MVVTLKKKEIQENTRRFLEFYDPLGLHDHLRNVPVINLNDETQKDAARKEGIRVSWLTVKIKMSHDKVKDIVYTVNSCPAEDKVIVLWGVRRKEDGGVEGISGNYTIFVELVNEKDENDSIEQGNTSGESGEVLGEVQG